MISICAAIFSESVFGFQLETPTKATTPQMARKARNLSLLTMRRFELRSNDATTWVMIWMLFKFWRNGFKSGWMSLVKGANSFKPLWNLPLVTWSWRSIIPKIVRETARKRVPTSFIGLEVKMISEYYFTFGNRSALVINLKSKDQIDAECEMLKGKEIKAGPISSKWQDKLILIL